MRVLFVIQQIDYEPQGIMHLSSALKAAGHEVELAVAAHHDPVAVARDWQPDVRVGSEQAVAVLLEQIAALPASQREAFLLKEEGGLSVDEIAAATRVNRETAKSRLRYALQRLRAGLGDLL